MKDRVRYLMELREEILKRHPVLERMQTLGELDLRAEAIVAQYVLAAAMLEVDASIQAQSPT